ncbi:YdcF family protein [uncultured Maricaulis sp.]|uniref:YdcF family protein n=1 Tax=uncultured Maricaulis sp. TaxID=174710 RepID=UPI0030D83231|tara:strand:- start:179343 stop:179933 length:591 start_codon:yes stop_codon:yes gene_type:complete
MKQGGSLLRALAFAIVAVSLIGFGVYAGTVSGYAPPDATLQADGIVVLTGDQGRLTAGVQLLQDGRSAHLLVSGVHPSVTTEELRAQTDLTDAQFSCCVELGREATDTVGNARETAQWVRANGYQRLIIVTSDYHLPRSLIEMDKAMPDVEFIPYPVRTEPPWRNPRAARLWMQEYAKYSTVWIGRTLFPASDHAS